MTETVEEEPDPPEFVPPDHWDEGEMAKWQSLAVEAIRLCAQTHDTFINHMVWALVPNPPHSNRKPMLRAVQRAIKEKIIERTDEHVPAPKVYVTADGKKFALNKVVPVYRSLLR